MSYGFTGNAVWQLVAQSDLVTQSVLLILLGMSILCWALFLYKCIVTRIKIRQLEQACRGLEEVQSIEDVKNGMESIKAHASGPVFVQLDALQLHSTHDLLSTADGVTLSIPQSSHAQIQATTITQAIYCDHFITLTPRTMRLNKNTWQEMQRNIHALLGNGGALLKLSAYKGVHITY